MRATAFGANAGAVKDKSKWGELALQALGENRPQKKRKEKKPTAQDRGVLFTRNEETQGDKKKFHEDKFYSLYFLFYDEARIYHKFQIPDEHIQQYLYSVKFQLFNDKFWEQK
jgi:hypothetical protein